MTDPTTSSPPPPRAHPWRRRLAAVVAGFMLLVVLAWIVGRLTSDRYVWSQWLLWLPTPAAGLAALLGLLTCWRARRGRLVWAAMLVGLAAWFAFVDHRLLRSRTYAGPGLRLVHWTMPRRAMSRLEQYIEILRDLDGDLTIVAQIGRFLGDERLLADLSGGRPPVTMGTFTLLCSHEVLEWQWMFRNSGVDGLFVRLDTTESLGRPLTIYLLDLPSDPRRPRMKIAQTARRLIDEAQRDRNVPPPDLVLGDFNMTRNSAAMRTMFPTLRHAFDEAGSGYAASFHRAFPLYHIDHLLLGESIRAHDYRLVDPGVGRHRAQVAVIEAKQGTEGP